jgi:hypothetical protein
LSPDPLLGNPLVANDPFQFIFYSFVACHRNWEEFWAKYGDFSSTTRLLDSMRRDRASLDRADAALARAEEAFDTTYLTRALGDPRAKVMSKDVDIARRWREKQGLEACWWHTFA